jgi:hypothetical protein
MKRLYDWFWEWMDDQNSLHGQRTVAGLFSIVVLVAGLLLLWLTVLICD